MGQSSWSVGSAGIRATEGQSAARHSIRILAERGIDLTKHRSRVFDVDFVQHDALLLCMEQAHVEWLQHVYPQLVGNLHTLSDMSYQQGDVPDPYGGSLDAYRHMVNEVTFLIEAGLPRIIELIGDANGR